MTLELVKLLPIIIIQARADPPPPNIVIIVADDLGYNDVSWHNEVVKTPHLEELAKSGVLLEQHYSQPVCTPTRGALLTGRYPFHIGLQNGVIKPLNPWGLLPNLTTLADELRSAGYSTHAVGKWHLGFCNEKYLPTRRGFDHHYGFWLGAEDYYSHDRKSGYDFRDDLEVDTSSEGKYSSIIFGQRAEEIITSHNQSNPLFLYLPFQSVHAPLQAPQKYMDMYKEVKKSDRQIFLGMVTAMDDAVGVVMNSLKQAGMFENTFVIFFSDNGGALVYGANNWPLRGDKGTLWEGGTRTPAFIHGPGISPRAENRMFHVTDWYPTLLDAIHMKPSGPPMDGVSLWNSLRNSSDDWERNEIVYNIYDPSNPTAAIRVGDWKYIWKSTGFDGWEKPPELRSSSAEKPYFKKVSNYNELYNLAEDPLEKENLAEFEQERVKELREKLSVHFKDVMEVDYSFNDPAGKPEHFKGVWSTGWC